MNNALAGSGRKFKKCCIGREKEAKIIEDMLLRNIPKAADEVVNDFLQRIS